MQKLGYSRAELFIQFNKPALKLLPEANYSCILVKKVRVHADYLVEINKHYNSVLCSLLGQHQQLEAWIFGELVRLFNQGQEVAVHPRHSDARPSPTEIPSSVFSTCGEISFIFLQNSLKSSSTITCPSIPLI